LKVHFNTDGVDDVDDIFRPVYHSVDVMTERLVLRMPQIHSLQTWHTCQLYTTTTASAARALLLHPARVIPAIVRRLYVTAPSGNSHTIQYNKI